MIKITGVQNANLVKVHRSGVATVPTVTARALIGAGYLRQVPYSTAPVGMRCELTAKGRAWITE